MSISSMETRITTMLQKSLGISALTEQGKLAKYGDHVATEVQSLCEIEVGLSDNQLVEQLADGARRLCRGRIVSLRPVSVHKLASGKKFVLASVGFI